MERCPIDILSPKCPFCPVENHPFSPFGEKGCLPDRTERKCPISRPFDREVRWIRTYWAQEARASINIHCSDPSYVLRERSKPIGCQIKLILNSWRFSRYVLWAQPADVSPVWPQRNTCVLVGVCSWWYFDYSWWKLLSWLCVYFQLTDITLAILNSICKYSVKSMTMLDDFQFLPSTYNAQRLSTYVYNTANYIPPHWHDNSHDTQITCYQLPHSENVPGRWDATWELFVDNVRNDLLNRLPHLCSISSCVRSSEDCGPPMTASPLLSKGMWYHGHSKMYIQVKIMSCMYCVRLATWRSNGRDANKFSATAFYFICFIIYEILAKYFSCWLNRVLPIIEHRM